MESASAPQEAAKAPEAEEAGAAEQSETQQQEDQTEAQPISPPEVADASLEGDSAAKEDEGAAEAGATSAQEPKAQPDEEPTPATVSNDPVSEAEQPASAPEVSLPATGGMQFPYAGSAGGFVAPTPTPIRPLHGDPRAMPPGMMRMQTDTSQGMTTNDAAADNSLNVQPQLPPTSAMGYAIPASRMFHHPSASPSFYNTTQDGPAPVGPTILDPSFEKQWEATRAATNAQPDSSIAWSSSDPMQDASAVNSMVRPNLRHVSSLIIRLAHRCGLSVVDNWDCRHRLAVKPAVSVMRCSRPNL